MIDFGKDFTAIPDLGFGVKESYANLAEAIGRRLTTPSLQLFYDRTYGFDVREYLNETWNDAIAYEFTSLVEAEIRKDGRVIDCKVSVDATNILASRQLQVYVEATTTFGPFSLVVNVSDLNAEVLYGNAI